jgi:hypothetical protein
MPKSLFASYFKKPLLWVCLAVGIILVIALFLVMNLQSDKQSTKTAGTSNTGLLAAATPADDKSATVQALIKNYEVRGHSINTFRSADKRAQIYTGAFLDEWNAYYDSLDGSNNWTIVSEANVTQLKIVGYTDTKIIALACLSENELELDQKGKLVRQLPTNNFAGAYVFVSTEKTWKLANFINVTDTARARTIYNSLSNELKELSGPLSPLLKISCTNK